MGVETEESAIRAFGISDFLAFGQDYGIRYHFPDLPRPGVTDAPVARGRIAETALPSGFRFTRSDLEVFQSYESISLGHSPLLIVIVLAGSIRLSVGAVHRELGAGTAVSLQLRPEYALNVVQPAGQHLKTVTLAFDPAGPALNRAEHPMLTALLAAIEQPVWLWQPPGELVAALQQGLAATVPEGQKTLVLEGLALQLAGYGVPQGTVPKTRRRSLPSGQQQRLESVRQLLEFNPAEDYTLAQLARRAAMSPSSLRAKFRAIYGVSVFGYQRACRMALARRYLEQGHSVQQAAHRSGYRHATNFATAFRRYFGVSPGNLT